MAFVLTIVVAVGVTVFVMRDSGGSGSTGGSNAKGDIASANDTGPVSIITVDPTCAGWRPIQNALASSQSESWGSRDPSKPASAWTSAEKSQYEAAGSGMRSAADQAVTLARQTPHRVMRELYEQFIAYGRAYADSLPHYTSTDNFLAQTNISLSSGISSVCDAIDHGNMVDKSASAQPGPPPAGTGTFGDVEQPLRFLAQPSAVCADWVSKASAFDADLENWAKISTSTPSSQWTPAERDVESSAAKTFVAYASSTSSLGTHSENVVLDDIAQLAAVYFHVFAAGIPTYVANDTYVANVGFDLNNSVRAGCKASPN